MVDASMVAARSRRNRRQDRPFARRRGVRKVAVLLGVLGMATPIDAQIGGWVRRFRYGPSRNRVFGRKQLLKAFDAGNILQRGGRMLET